MRCPGVATFSHAMTAEMIGCSTSRAMQRMCMKKFVSTCVQDNTHQGHDTHHTFGQSHLNKALLECFRAHQPLLGVYPLYWEKDANSFTFKLYKRLSCHLGSARTSNTVRRDHTTTRQFHELSLFSVCHTSRQLCHIWRTRSTLSAQVLSSSFAFSLV